jgi:hypothetical protein
MKSKKSMQALSLLLVMILLGAMLVPVVSAENNYINAESPGKGTGATDSSSRELVPYVIINAYGPSSASVNEEVSIDVSGELGNMVNYYFQKFYIQNIETTLTSDVEYISVPDGFDLNIYTWTKGDYLVGHTNFNSHWVVKFKNPGRYEVVASAVGVAQIPAGQDRFIIDVS